MSSETKIESQLMFEAIEERYFSAHHMLIRAAAESLYEAQRYSNIPRQLTPQQCLLWIRC
jgi:hypothetical protein